MSKRRPTAADTTTTRKLTHLNAAAEVHMVAVDAKPESLRTATASGVVTMSTATVAALRAGTLKKGDALAVARIAGISGAKRAADLIPLCHPLRLTGIEVTLALRPRAVAISATVRAFDRTGVEMEALAAVSAAALTIYDMCKSVDKAMAIERIAVDHKAGGRSGTYRRDGASAMKTTKGPPARRPAR